MSESLGSSVGRPASCQLISPCAGDCHASEYVIRCTSGVHQPSGPSKLAGGAVGIASAPAGSLSARQMVGSHVVQSSLYPAVALDIRGCSVASTKLQRSSNEGRPC